ncbi:MAG: hypothetical protein L6U99_12120 [Clostridium sp.]|nr:MAG: hypothetical protein L6U99_12120 [Clostridium sp.]
MNKLYWEDKLSSSEKNMDYIFLAVYFENLEIDSPLNKIIPNDIKYRLKIEVIMKYILVFRSRNNVNKSNNL